MLSNRLRSRLTEIDWDFTGSRSESTFSRVHWHPGRFVSQIPSTLIGLLSEPGDTVADPFCGSGTVLVEAQRLGRTSVGFDINPVSVLIARAKTLQQSAKTIGHHIDVVVDDARIRLESRSLLASEPDPPREIPACVQRTKWYSPRVFQNLVLLWNMIGTYRDPRRTLAEAAFSSILLSVCRETRHWGFVCDNTRPLGNHSGDVLGRFLRSLSLLRRAYSERDYDQTARGQSTGKTAKAVVQQGNAAELLTALKRSTIDLVVTSPPYEGVVDYIKAQRLSMEWFGHALEQLRFSEIGARSKRHRLAARDEYFGSLNHTFTEVRRVMKRDAVCAVVIGESSKRQGTLSGVVSALKQARLRLLMDAARIGNLRKTSRRLPTRRSSVFMNSPNGRVHPTSWSEKAACRFRPL